jgi:hypothetical protein
VQETTAAVEGAVTDQPASALVGARVVALPLSAMGGASLVGRLMTGWLLDRFFAARVRSAILG